MRYYTFCILGAVLGNVIEETGNKILETQQQTEFNKMMQNVKDFNKNNKKQDKSSNFLPNLYKK